MKYLYHAIDFLLLIGLLIATAMHPDWDGGPLFAVFLYPIARYACVWGYQSSTSHRLPASEIMLGLADILAILGLLGFGIANKDFGMCIAGSVILSVLFFLRPLIKEKGFDITPEPEPLDRPR